MFCSLDLGIISSKLTLFSTCIDAEHLAHFQPNHISRLLSKSILLWFFFCDKATLIVHGSFSPLYLLFKLITLNDLNVRISLDYSAALMTEPTEENVTSAVDINIVYSHFSPSKFQSPLVISTIHSCSYIQRHFRLDTSLDNVGIDEARAAILLIWSSYRLNLRLWVMSVGQSNM